MNMFPLKVELEDGTRHTTCRLVYDGRESTIWRWDGSAFVIVFEADTPPIGPGPRWWFKTEAGTVTVERQDGCGCGHPLKRYTPTKPEASRVQRVYTDPEVSDAAV